MQNTTNTHATNSKASTVEASTEHSLRTSAYYSLLTPQFVCCRILQTPPPVNSRDLLLIAPPSLQPERSLFQHGPARWSEGLTGVVSASHRGLPRRGDHQHDHLFQRWTGVLRHHSQIPSRSPVSHFCTRPRSPLCGMQPISVHLTCVSLVFTCVDPMKTSRRKIY